MSDNTGDTPDTPNVMLWLAGVAVVVIPLALGCCAIALVVFWGRGGV